jgi:peptidoglycan/xylan/chitin deacetylase (PgdA/CDA1 family)
MKKAFFVLLYISGLTTFARWYYRKRVVFLCYHGVTKRPARSPDDPKGLHVNHLRFKQHLEFLRSHYHVVSLSDYITAQRERRYLPHYSVVLTFDDGFRNFLTMAAPLLAQYAMPATVFLVTDKARETVNRDLPSEWTPADDRTHLSWSEAKRLKEQQNVEFGSHTCSHSGLLTLSLQDAQRELLHSYQDLVSNLGVKAAILAYPKGQYSRVIADEARKVGYAGAVTTDRGRNEVNHDPFTLGRTLIGDNDDLPSFAVRVSGARSWLAGIRSFLMGRAKGVSYKTGEMCSPVAGPYEVHQ